jgi:hypothetical protein
MNRDNSPPDVDASPFRVYQATLVTLILSFQDHEFMIVDSVVYVEGRRAEEPSAPQVTIKLSRQLGGVA